MLTEYHFDLSSTKTVNEKVLAQVCLHFGKQIYNKSAVVDAVLGLDY